PPAEEPLGAGAEPLHSSPARRALHVLQHVAMEGPARIAEVARAMGFQVVTHALHEGARVPSSLPDGDLPVVMGGCMGAGDMGDARWPFLATEVELLGRLLRDGRPM